MNINDNYKKLETSYLFSTIAKKVSEFCEKNSDKKVIRLGIGDVTRPLCNSVVEAMISAVKEMGTQEGFHGYGPEQGYDFLKEKIQKYYIDNSNVNLKLNEIFISEYKSQISFPSLSLLSLKLQSVILLSYNS